MRWLWAALVVATIAACGDGDPQPALDGTSGSATGTAAGNSDATGSSSSDSGDGSDVSSGSGSSGGSDGSSTGTAGCGPAPDPAPAWLTPFQDEIVAALSGQSEVAPGVTLIDRATPTRRMQAATYLAERFEQLGLEPLTQDYADGGTNVYARLPATTGSDRYLVLGAHYDSVPGSPGANDNATGVALVLAVARYLDAVRCRDRHVIFALFDQEEIGLVGSFNFASLLSTEGLDVEAVHTVDQMGWDADGDRTVELERADEGLFEGYADASATLPAPVPLTPTPTGATDHVSFRNLGFAAVGLTEEFVSGDTTPHYHLPSDSYETVDLAYLASSTALANARFAAATAP